MHCTINLSLYTLTLILHKGLIIHSSGGLWWIISTLRYEMAKVTSFYCFHCLATVYYSFLPISSCIHLLLMSNRCTQYIVCFLLAYLRNRSTGCLLSEKDRLKLSHNINLKWPSFDNENLSGYDTASTMHRAQNREQFLSAGWQARP